MTFIYISIANPVRNCKKLTLGVPACSFVADWHKTEEIAMMGLTRYPTVDEGQAIEPGLVRPRDITDFGGTFGSYEVEQAASRLVEFFKQSNRWLNFRIEELIEFYRERSWNPNGMFFGLTGGPHLRGNGMWLKEECPTEPMIICVHGQYFVVTRTFINRCAENVSRQTAA